jgi:hypothetical protein
MDQRGAWIARNGALAFVLYVAVAANVDWLQYAIAGFAWWTLAAVLWSAPAGGPRTAAFSDPHPLAELAFDLAVLASMFLAQWYWSVFAFATARGCSAIIRERATRGS